MSLVVRSGELVELAQRFGYFPPEPIATPAPMAFEKPFSGARSILAACVIAAVGRANPIAQSDALAATAYSLRRGDSKRDQLAAFALAADNLRESYQYWISP